VYTIGDQTVVAISGTRLAGPGLAVLRV